MTSLTREPRSPTHLAASREHVNVVAYDMITVPEAARRIGRHPETIRRWIRSGRLRSQRVGTQHLVDEAELRAVAAADAPLDLPTAWRTADDGTPLPDWERLVRDARERH